MSADARVLGTGGIPNAVTTWFSEQTGVTWEPIGLTDGEGMILSSRDAWTLAPPWTPSAAALLPRQHWHMKPQCVVGMGRIQHVVGDLGQFLFVIDNVRNAVQFRLRGNAVWSEVDYARIAYEKRLQDARHRMAKASAGEEYEAAVKLIKEKAGLGLKDSKDLFDEFDKACTAFAHNDPNSTSIILLQVD